jgi:PAS domain S-box-containing protein
MCAAKNPAGAINPAAENKNDLRKQAEQRVPIIPTNVSELSAAEVAKLVYELEIHQEELEIQNEELRRIQLELRESGERYADLYDFAPVGYLTINVEGSILKANLSAATMLGCDRSKLMGSRLALYCDQDSRMVLRDHLDQVLTQRQSHRCEVKIDTPDSTPRYLQLDSNRVDDAREEGQLRVAMTNITGRKQAEMALAEKDVYLRSLVDAVPVLICHVDSGLHVQFTNSSYENWFDVTAEEAKCQNIEDTLGALSNGEIADYLADALAGRRVNFEMQLTHRTNGQRHMQMMLVPDIGSRRAVTGIHVLGIDITDRKLVESQNARRRSFSERLVRLTSAERDVYELMIRGKMNKVIAFELDIGLRTTERRRQNALEKLEVDSVAELLQQLADVEGIFHD